MIKKLLVMLICGLRALLGPEGCCRYEFTCTQFALLQLKEKPLLPALFSIVKRLLTCRPL